MTDNIKTCDICGNTLIDEELENHYCNTVLKGSKEIEIVYFIITNDGFNRKVILAKGLDGIMYNLIISNKNSNVITSHPEITTQKSTPKWNTQRKNRT